MGSKLEDKILKEMDSIQIEIKNCGI